MAETIDAFLHLVKRETQGKVSFKGVSKLRRLDLRVPRVKQLLEEDGRKNHGRFDDLLASIPDYDSGKTMESTWHCFVVSRLDEIKQYFQKLRVANKVETMEEEAAKVEAMEEEAAKVEAMGEAAKVEAVGEAAKVEAMGEAAKVEAVGEAAKVEAVGEAAKVEAVGEEAAKVEAVAEAAKVEAMAEEAAKVEAKVGVMKDSSAEAMAEATAEEAMVEVIVQEVRERLRAALLPQRGAAKRPLEGNDDCFAGRIKRFMQQHARKLQEELGGTPAKGSDQEALSKQVVKLSAELGEGLIEVVKVSAKLGAVSNEVSCHRFDDKMFAEIFDDRAPSDDLDLSDQRDYDE